MSQDTDKPAEETPVGVADVEPGEDSDDELRVLLAEQSEALENQRAAMAEMLAIAQGQQAEIAELKQRVTAGEQPELTAEQIAEAEHPVSAVRPGYVRFFAPLTSEYWIVMQRKGVVMIDNTPIIRDQRTICFANGVYDTDDPDEIEFLRRQIERGDKEIVENPEAQPRSSVTVIDGARGSGTHSPSAPKPGAPALAARI